MKPQSPVEKRLREALRRIRDMTSEYHVRLAAQAALANPIKKNNAKSGE